ncbi:Protein of unknown function [Cotesia congregata]|uniref:Uncharacterized protein n=1 Tax=Cotesia congregata TaxID=51543 RepID=A0A8J2ML16_COTCN|nr:Protein of unknown function [Cotesia congregata]
MRNAGRVTKTERVTAGTRLCIGATRMELRRKQASTEASTEVTRHRAVVCLVKSGTQNSNFKSFSTGVTFWHTLKELDDFYRELDIGTHTSNFIYILADTRPFRWVCNKILLCNLDGKYKQNDESLINNLNV